MYKHILETRERARAHSDFQAKIQTAMSQKEITPENSIDEMRRENNWMQYEPSARCKKNIIRVSELWSFSKYLCIINVFSRSRSPDRAPSDRQWEMAWILSHTHIFFVFSFFSLSFAHLMPNGTKHNRCNKNRTQTRTRTPNRIQEKNVSKLLKKRVHITFVWSLIQNRHLHCKIFNSNMVWLHLAWNRPFTAYVSRANAPNTSKRNKYFVFFFCYFV